MNVFALEKPTATGMSKGERLYSLDAARAVAMLLMVQGHTLDALVTSLELDITRWPWDLWHFLRGLTAPVFLLLSGIVHILATRRGADGRLPTQLVWRRLRWAITLIGIGYLMMFPAQRIWHLHFITPEQWSAFFRVHILQLIGVLLLFVLGIFLLTRSNHRVGLIGLMAGIVVIAAAPAAAWVDWYQVLPEPVAAYMSTARGSLFPIVPFAAYLLLGLPLGSWLQHSPAEHRAVLLRVHWPLLGLSILALSPLLTLWCQPLIPPQANPYHANPGLILLRFGLALLFLGATAWVFHRAARWAHLFALLGRYALFIFVGHLVALYGTPWFNSLARLYPKSLSLAEGIAATLLVIAVCVAGIAVVEAVRRYRISWHALRLALSVVVLYWLIGPW